MLFIETYTREVQFLRLVADESNFVQIVYDNINNVINLPDKQEVKAECLCVCNFNPDSTVVKSQRFVSIYQYEFIRGLCVYANEM